MRCVVFGATGYLGMRLVPQLLAAGHDVRVVARTPAKLDDVPWRGDVEVVEGDVTDDEKVRQALTDQQVLYYLVHSMLAADFVRVDARGASIVADAAAQAGITRIVYVGGIIAENQQLSDHLASRAEVGRLLHDSGVPTAELRAAAIIGAGSASFEMLRYLTERLPLMVTPRWLRTRVQPIAVRDVLYYLVNAAELPADVSRAFDIGGPDTFTYTEMIRKYAAIAGLQRRVAIPVPVLTPLLSSHWVNLITPLPRSLASSLMESLENDVVCAEHDIAAHIPDPDGGLTHYEDAVQLALGADPRRRVDHTLVPSEQRRRSLAATAHRSGLVRRITARASVGTTCRGRRRDTVAGIRVDRRRARLVGGATGVGTSRLDKPRRPQSAANAAGAPTARRRGLGLVACRACRTAPTAAVARGRSVTGPAVAGIVGMR